MEDFSGLNTNAKFSPYTSKPIEHPYKLIVTVGRVSTARLLGMCGNHG
jgi:hypothetical protein